MNWFKDTWNRLTTFLKEVRAEMAKVSFPSREEVVATTVVVIIASFIFGIFLFMADWVIARTFGWLVGAFGA
jgi:preprotein translocase subunit SecE